MRQVSYDEMLELASLGAGVMHGGKIEFAVSVPIHVRSSFSRSARLDDYRASPRRPAQAGHGTTLTVP